MRNFFERTFQIKLNAGICFLATVIFYSVISLIYGETHLSIYTLIAFAIISMLCSTIHHLIFSDIFIKKMRYSLRMVIFVIPLLAIIITSAYLNRWLSLEVVGSWLIFVGVFSIAFIGLAVGYEVYFRITGNRYSELLLEFKSKKQKR